ncbi:MAG: YeeE/YedE family protein [Hyphomicrobiales bacterium]|nr:YeeE/YedE family protein [Hyphomicrobiales bacterium]
MSILRLLVGLASGVLFGFGLAFSGMMDPGRVEAFLDITGPWSANLAFVLCGAVLVASIGVQISKRMRHPVLADTFNLPSGTTIDARLLCGAAIFGLGWGLAGFCPGPAVASLSLGLPIVLAFVAAMSVGMILHDRLAKSRNR